MIILQQGKERADKIVIATQSHVGVFCFFFLFLLVAMPHTFYLDLIRNSLLTAVNR